MGKILGLDLGIASVGYAIVNIGKKEEGLPDRIINIGVRTFPVAENPKDGASLAFPRRAARMVRRVIRRKALRIRGIKRLFIETDFLSETQVKTLTNNVSVSPWSIRKEALSSVVSNDDFARVLLHIAKRRGFKSMRKAQEEADKGDTGKLLKGIKELQETFKQKEYQTIGEDNLDNTVVMDNKVKDIPKVSAPVSVSGGDVDSLLLQSLDAQPASEYKGDYETAVGTKKEKDFDISQNIKTAAQEQAKADASFKAANTPAPAAKNDSGSDVLGDVLGDVLQSIAGALTDKTTGKEGDVNPNASASSCRAFCKQKGFGSYQYNSHPPAGWSKCGCI